MASTSISDRLRELDQLTVQIDVHLYLFAEVSCEIFQLSLVIHRRSAQQEKSFFFNGSISVKILGVLESIKQAWRELGNFWYVNITSAFTDYIFTGTITNNCSTV